MKNRISIDLFRVSSDSQYLDLIFQCPSASSSTSESSIYMNKFQLEVRDGEGNSQRFDLSDALFAGEGKKSAEERTYDWTVRIPLYKLGIDYPAIYIATLGCAVEVEEDEEPVTIPEATAICSDVNFVYQCLLDQVIESCDVCSRGNQVSDDAIRNYLILYGHQAAMFRRDLDVAERYFRILSRCFDNCNDKKKCCGGTPKVKSDCGCKK